MADFSTNLTEPSGSPFTPQSPVVDNSASTLVEVAGAALSFGGQVVKQKKDVEGLTILNEFTQENLKYANAVDQGRMTSQDARMAMRASFSKYIANNPALYEEIQGRQDDIISKAGLGKVIAEGTSVEQADIALQKETISAGWVRPDAPPALIREVTRRHADYKKAKQELADLQAEASYQSTLVGLDASKLSLHQNRLREKGMNALFNLNAAYTPQFKYQMDEIVRRHKAGEITQEQAIEEVKTEWTSVAHTVSQVGHRAGNENIANLSSGMKSMYENTISHLDGKMSLELLNTQNEKSISLASQRWLADPTLSTVIAGSRLLPNSDLLTVYSNLNPTVISFIKKNSLDSGSGANLLTNDPAEKRDVTTYLKMVKDNLSKANGKGLDDNEKTELDTNVKNILKSVQAYNAAVDSPEAYQQVVDFLSSPEFGKYVTTKGGVPVDVAHNAKQILKQNYEDEVVPLLKKEYDTATLVSFPITGAGGRRPSGATVTPLNSAIKPEFSGGGVTFRAQEGADLAIQAEARKLNKRVAPVVNRLIRMAAHLDSNQDYRKVYEDFYAPIFGEGLPEAQKTAARTPAPAKPQPKPRPLPSIGEVVNGFEFVGGDPTKQSSWRPTNG